jgi:hypothetical protein
VMRGAEEGPLIAAGEKLPLAPFTQQKQPQQLVFIAGKHLSKPLLGRRETLPRAVTSTPPYQSTPFQSEAYPPSITREALQHHALLSSPISSRILFVGQSEGAMIIVDWLLSSGRAAAHPSEAKSRCLVPLIAELTTATCVVAARGYHRAWIFPPPRNSLGRSLNTTLSYNSCLLCHGDWAALA